MFKYFMGLYNSPHSQIFAGFTIKLPVWNIALTTLSSRLIMFLMLAAWELYTVPSQRNKLLEKCLQIQYCLLYI